MVLQLTASPCYGGPERQILELGKELARDHESVYATFREEERCWDFVDNARRQGFEVIALKHDTPQLVAAYRELKDLLKRLKISILICHGYKAGLVGRLAARSLGIPAVAVSRGWTGESFRVRVFEWFDRLNLRCMDHVVCVSWAQAEKLRQAGVSGHRITVIHNAVRVERFSAPRDPMWRQKLLSLFPTPPTYVIGAAGRLSPEKGFDILIEACRCLASDDRQDFGMILFGDGPLRERLQVQIDTAGLSDRVVLAGFTNSLDHYMRHFDVFVQSSHTEGLPNVLLEAAAAGIPVVATDVGGTRELVLDDQTGILIPPGSSVILADSIRTLLDDDSRRAKIGAAASAYVIRDFSFERQAQDYRKLFAVLPLKMRPDQRVPTRVHITERTS